MCVNESCLLTLTRGYHFNKWRKSCILWKAGSLSYRACEMHTKCGSSRHLVHVGFAKTDQPMLLLIYVSILLQIYWTALVRSDFCPVHPGNDCTCLSQQFCCHVQREWTGVDRHYLGDRPLEPGTTPTQKNFCGHEGENYQKLFSFTFSASLFIPAIEIVWQQTRSFTEQLQSPELYHWLWKPGLTVNWCFWSVWWHTRTGKC